MTIIEELKNIILPTLLDMMPEGTPAGLIDDMFSEMYYSLFDDVPRVTLKPPTAYGYDSEKALQFNPLTGEFIELTVWGYIREQGERVTEDTIFTDPAGHVEKYTIILKHYLRNDLKAVCNYEQVIKNRTPLTVEGQTIYKYNCPIQTIYLTPEGYPITYDKQRVKNNTYQYAFIKIDESTSIDDDVYTIIAPYEWKRTAPGGGGVSG